MRLTFGACSESKDGVFAFCFQPVKWEWKPGKGLCYYVQENKQKNQHTPPISHEWHIKYAKLNMFIYDIFLILKIFVNLCCCHCFCSPSDLGCPGNLSKLFSWWENTFVFLSFIGGCLLYCVTAGGACMCAWVVKQIKQFRVLLCYQWRCSCFWDVVNSLKLCQKTKKTGIN